MKTMKQMQDEMLSQCFKGPGYWPRPFVHFGGAIELAKNQEHYDRLMKLEIRYLAISLGIVGLGIILLAWFLYA